MAGRPEKRHSDLILTALAGDFKQMLSDPGALPDLLACSEGTLTSKCSAKLDSRFSKPQSP